MAFRDMAEDDPLRLMLITPRDGHLFDNGEVFTHPRPLQGVPLARITEDNTYWQRSWKSLDQYIEGEQHQEKMKEKYRILEASITGAMSTEESRKIKEKAKFHSDNVSKQRKIREVFGASSPYHPNQVVAKEYLPAEGLCEQEIMYKLACKISDLQVLSAKGELNMDPFDFIRWRISLKMMQKDVWKRGANSNPVRSIITKLGDDGPPNSGKQYEDPLFRAAILRSAKHQGTSNKYGAKKTMPDQSTGAQNTSSAHSSLSSGLHRRESKMKGQGERQVSPAGESKAQLRARLRERRRERAKLNDTGYTGTARRGVPG